MNNKIERVTLTKQFLVNHLDILIKLTNLLLQEDNIIDFIRDHQTRTVEEIDIILPLILEDIEIIKNIL